MTGINKKNFDVKKLLSGILAVVMVAAIILGCLGMLAGCSNSNGDKKEENNSSKYDAMTDSEYFQALAADTLEDGTDALASAFGVYADIANTATGKLGASAELKLQLGDTIVGLLEAYATQLLQENLDLSSLCSVDLDLEVDANEELTQLQVALGLSDTEILALQLILSDETIYAGAPQLNDAYLALNLADLNAMINFAQTEKITEMLEILPDEEKLSEILDRYADLMIQQIDKVEREKTTLENGELKQDCTVLNVKIDEEDVLAGGKAVLTAAKDDQDLKKIIEGFSTYYNNMMAESFAEFEMEWENVDMYAEFTAFVADTLENMPTEGDTENYIALKVYVDADHKIIGCELTLPTEETPAIRFITVTAGNNFKSTFEVASAEIKILGSGTTENGVIDGTYNLIVDGTSVIDIELYKFDTTTKDTISGNVVLTPSADLLDQVMGQFDMLPIDDIALEIKLDIKDDSSNIEMMLVGNDAMIVSLALKLAEKTSSTVEVPTNTIDGIGMGVGAWLKDADFSTVFANLRTADVPETLVAALESAWEMFAE